MNSSVSPIPRDSRKKMDMKKMSQIQPIKVVARFRYLKLNFSLVICFGVSAVVYVGRLLPHNVLFFIAKLADPHRDHSEKKFGKCENFTDEIWRGYWVERKGLSRTDFLNRQIMDTNIRLAMKWPAELYRNDSRCSGKYPIPGYRIQSLCNPESNNPCCNTKDGSCGISAHFCNCTECTDFRDFKSTELMDWVTENANCGLRNISTKEACEVLNKHKIRITFIGDSLIRQLSSMMLILLSGDPLLGAMPARASQSDMEKCKGEFQIVDKDCSIYLSAHSTGETRNGSICGGNYLFAISSVQVYMNTLTDEAIEKTTALLGVENSYLVIGVGMHFHLDVPLVKRVFIDKLLDLINKNGSGWPKIIWIGIHNVDGFLRVDTKFHNDAIQDFNHAIRTYLEEKNITFIRTFEMSKNLRSYDGQHYGVGFNYHKIQIILNYLVREYLDNSDFMSVD